MAQKITNGAMDERIVKLNEFMGVKMAQLSKGKRTAAKFNKEVAKYLLTNWDKVEVLQHCIDNMHNKMPKGCEEVMEIYDHRVNELLAEDKEKKKQEKAERKRIREEKRAKRDAEAAAKELSDKRKPGAPKTHKVGDRHPKHPWVWTEYQKGKFDWRIDPALKQKPGKKSCETANQPKKKKVAGKAKKAEPAAAPKLTLTELLAKPAPQGLSKPQHNVIKSLKKGFRLRKDGDALWLTDAAGNNERTEKGVLEALQRRYKIDYIPDDIWYNEKI